MKRNLVFSLIIIFLIGLEFTILKNKEIGKSSLLSVDECKSLREGEQKQCWEKTIDNVLKKEGVDKAYEKLAYIFENEKDFGPTCHAISHKIGQDAYKLFSQHKDFKVSPKTAYCSYGFYHGFMEALVSTSGDVKKAKEFCAYVDAQIGKISPDAFLQCYHGIGHGTVNNHDPKTWGSEQSMIDPALKLCEQASQSESDLSRCATGVFNGIANFYMAGEYNLKVRKDDPLWICRKQQEKYKNACYISLNVTLLWMTDGDLGKAAKYVEDIDNDIYAQHAIMNLAAPVASKNADAPNHNKYIDVCRTLQLRLHYSCIQGYAFGFLEHGLPEKEYLKAFEFCRSKSLDISEQKSCFEYIFSYLPQWYRQDKVEQICNEVETTYRDLCKEKTNTKK